MFSTDRTLILIRHAQTLHIQHGKSDKERDLKPEGIIEAQLAGNFLKTFTLNEILFFSSAANRALTTSRIIADQLNYPQENIVVEEDIYSGKLNDMLTLIGQVDDRIKTIILVGHHPTIAETHDYISRDKIKVMSACEIAGIEVNSTWSKITANIGHTSIQFHPSQFASYGKL